MRYFKRSLVASALVVPLLVAGAGSALAAEATTGATFTAATIADRISLNHEGNGRDGHYPTPNGFDYGRDYGRVYYYHDGYNYGGYTYQGHYRLLGIL